MKLRLAAFLVFALAPFACSRFEGDAPSPPLDRAPAPSRAAAPSSRARSAPAHAFEAPPAARWLAASAGGRTLSLVDARGGAVAEVALPGERLARGLVADAANGRAVVFTEDEDGESGELLAIAVDAGALGPPTHLGWLDGDARLAASGGLVLMFERSYGDAWKRLDSGGASLPRWPARPPLATAAGEHGVEVLFADAAGALSLARVAADAPWPPEPIAIGAAGLVPEARIAASESGDLWLFETSGDELSVRRPTPGSTPRPLGVALEGGVLEQVTTIGDRFALAISGSDLLVTVTIDEAGAPRDVERIEVAEPLVAGADEGWPVEALARLGAAAGIVLATRAGVVGFGEKPDHHGLVRDAAFTGSSFVPPIASWP